MKESRRLVAAVMLCSLMPLASACSATSEEAAGEGSAEVDAAPGPVDSGGIPGFMVDPSWPREMPNKWIMGAVTGVFVDAEKRLILTNQQYIRLRWMAKDRSRRYRKASLQAMPAGSKLRI